MSFFHKKDSSSKSKNNTSTISHDNNDADSLSSVSSSASYSLPQTQPQTQMPPQVTQHSSSSSLESNTATAHNPHIVKQPGVAAKPKKGILKTMTKVQMIFVVIQLIKSILLIKYKELLFMTTKLIGTKIRDFVLFYF